ncbi:hypothetical protein [Tranquillimonas alkanivorans]|uniref:Tyr recombinase domain-containing protein n=1 Tax=Tranquillimonas alkanivorans TaxID=441119 RepID=A0A1I5VY17_9RHOB|nr:hypothetical protein [Tranquillimonas alkanivorans]SFQ12375.1 hypothetical protein SAMN04488047_13723 [Tranquillimonas alkanivorans]
MSEGPYETDSKQGAPADAARALAQWSGAARTALSPADWRDFLDWLRTERGDAAAWRLADRLAPLVLARWGRETATGLAIALREARCSEAGPARTAWDGAKTAISGLPDDWQAPLLAVLERSRAAEGHLVRPGSGALLSAATLRGVGYSLQAWHRYCAGRGSASRPTATGFETWAADMEKDGRALRTISGGLCDVLIGWRLITPGDDLRAAEWVSSDWTERAMQSAPPTKRAAGTVPATEIFRLGLRLFEEADAAPLPTPSAAAAARNALLLIVAAALPQRARALSHLDSALSFRLLEDPLIRVRLPGYALKRRETQKAMARAGFHATLENPALWDVVHRYLSVHRPLLDDGTGLWPSLRRRGKRLDPGRLGEIIGDLTEEHLKTRVSIHRVRDAVGTEATEELPQGGRIAPVLLGHRDPRTTARHYDHSEGLAATRAWAAVASRGLRQRPSLLD